MRCRVLAWPLRATGLRITVAVVWVALLVASTLRVLPMLEAVAAVACWIVAALLVLVPTSMAILTFRRPATLEVSPQGLRLTLDGSPGEVAAWHWSEVHLIVERREDGDTLSIRPADGSSQWVVMSAERASLDRVADGILAEGGRVDRR